MLGGEHEFLRDALRSEGIKLTAKILVIRANASVSDPSPALRSRGHVAVRWCKSKVQNATV